MIDEAKTSGIDIPEMERTFKTNFIR